MRLSARLHALGVAATLLIGCQAASGGALQRGLISVASIPLPGNTSRFDYQSIDPARRLLFIAHLGDSSIDVIDTSAQRVLKVINDVDSVHGVLVVPELHRLYATATGSNELAVIDERTLRIVARSPAGEYPDGIAYAPRERKLFISDESGGTVTVVDARSNRRLATISLGGEAGNTQYDPATGQIYVNAQTLNQLVQIDPRRDTIARRFSLAYCQNNHGLLINAAARTAYIACDGNATLLTFDMQKNKVVAKNDVGDGPDVLALDAKNRRLYVACESGVVAIFVVGRDGGLSKISQGFLGTDAHTVAVDPSTGQVYFPIQSSAGKPVLRVFRPAGVE